MVLTTSDATEIGSGAPNFSLEGTDGKAYSLASFEGATAYVIMFICNHCPYVKAVEDRLIALGAELKELGVAVVGIMPNDVSRYPDDHPDRMRERAQQKSYTFPYLYDATQSVARAYGAVCTPDFFVYDRERRLAYRGRLDDSWKHPDKVVVRDLKNAVDALLAGEEPSKDQIPAMGCSIKWRL